MATRCAENYGDFALSVWVDEIGWANGFGQRRPDTEDDDDDDEQIMMDGQGGEEEHDDDNENTSANHCYWEAGGIDMEQAQKAREIIDTITKTLLEYRTTDLPKPTKHSSFVAVGQDEVAEL